MSKLYKLIKDLRNNYLKINISGAIRVSVVLTCILYLLNSIYENLDKISSLEVRSKDIYLLLLATLISIISLYFNALAWKALLEWIGYSSSRIKIIRLFLLTNILKYIPGGVWHFVGRVRVLKGEMGYRNSIAAVLLEPVLMIAAALFLVPLGSSWGLASIVFLLPSFLFSPKIIKHLFLKLERIKANEINKIELADKDAILDDIVLGKNGYPINAFLLEITFIFFRFLGFWFCLKPFSINDLIPLNNLMALFSLSWTAGLIVPGAPGGVGVFELAFFFFSASEVPEANLLAGLLCYRLISTLSDLFSALIVKSRDILKLI